jgi:hypothetical protein
MYTIKTIANFLGVDYGYIERIIETYHLKPVPLYGLANLKKSYTFHQLLIIQNALQQISYYDLYFDLVNEEVFMIYSSSINLEWL